MKERNRPYDLEVIAGPCSINYKNLHELYNMSEIQVTDQKGNFERALNAVRFVGLKSRTECSQADNEMGIDVAVIEQAIMHGSLAEVPPSVLLAEKFIKETDMGIATEIMLPGIQMPFYEGRIPKGKLLAWNPSNNQLGWSVKQMASTAARNEWAIGLKNGKWLGEPYSKITQPNDKTITSMEKAWLGLSSYASVTNCNLAFIHRGVDIPEKGEHRSALVHEVVKRLARKIPQAGRYLDPSHSLGPKLRDDVVKETIDAMKMTVDNDYLYTGILIEAGTSNTDTDQHISIAELKTLLEEIAKFRKLKCPTPSM